MIVARVQRKDALILALRIGTLVEDPFGDIRIGLRFFSLV